MYNLDEVVEGLDVVDFPGVDDMDETIPDLAELLITLAQIVVFVVDYRYACSNCKCVIRATSCFSTSIMVIDTHSSMAGKSTLNLPRSGWKSFKIVMSLLWCV